MGATLGLKFPTKEARDRIFTFVNDHLLTLEFSKEDYARVNIDIYNIKDHVHITKAGGNRILFDYPIWFSGPYKLWLYVFAKWASYTAGIRKSKIDGKTFDVPVPVVYHDSIGYYNFALKKNGQPDYYNRLWLDFFPDFCASYANVKVDYWKDFHNEKISKQKTFLKYLGEDVKPFTSKINKKLKVMTKLWDEQNVKN